jgi:molybdopterin synthase catalytic subunit
MKFTVSLTKTPIAISPPPFPLEGNTGALLEFYGVVRGWEAGRPIGALEYEAYEEMAREELERICRELGKIYPYHRLEIVHRVGEVPVGEPSLHIRVYCVHRREALALLGKLVELLKDRVPIWKEPRGDQHPSG